MPDIQSCGMESAHAHTHALTNHTLDGEMETDQVVNRLI